jgi:hypothetical protein
MGSFIDRTGKRYGRLVALEPARLNGRSAWRCLCDCGRESVVEAGALSSGNTKTCGVCNRRERAKNNGKTHGESNTPLWKTWMSIKRRVKHDPYYKGMELDEGWRTSYETFRDWARANGYVEGLTVDRIDNAKGYTPENCRWANRAAQARHRSTTKMSWEKIAEAKKLREQGLYYHQIGERLGVSRSTVRQALNGERWAVPSIVS